MNVEQRDAIRRGINWIGERVGIFADPEQLVEVDRFMAMWALTVGTMLSAQCDLVSTNVPFLKLSKTGDDMYLDQMTKEQLRRHIDEQDEKIREAQARSKELYIALMDLVDCCLDLRHYQRQTIQPSSALLENFDQLTRAAYRAAQQRDLP